MTERSLRQRRHSLGLTQGQVADVVGISRPYYTQLENGSRVPSMRVARQLALVFRISLDTLLLLLDRSR